jgi:hypothetical protein
VAEIARNFDLRYAQVFKDGILREEGDDDVASWRAAGRV